MAFGIATLISITPVFGNMIELPNTTASVESGENKDWHTVWEIQFESASEYPVFLYWVYKANNEVGRKEWPRRKYTIAASTRVFVNGVKVYKGRGENVSPQRHYKIFDGFAMYTPRPGENTFVVEIQCKVAASSKLRRDKDVIDLRAATLTVWQAQIIDIPFVTVIGN